MKKQRFKLIPACYLYLEKDNKILLLKRKNTGWQDGNYSFIAGHLDGDETFTQAMTREAYEEANIKINPADLKIIHVSHRSRIDTDGERIDIFMKADKWFGNIKNNEPEKCAELAWFSIDDLPSNIAPYIRNVIGMIIKKNFYSENGFENIK